MRASSVMDTESMDSMHKQVANDVREVYGQG